MVPESEETDLSPLRFPFDERVTLYLLYFLSEKDSQNLYLHDCLVAVIPEGLCHFCCFFQVCITVFYCWKIETWETAQTS